MDEDWEIVSENCEIRRLREAAEEETECVCGRSTDGRCHCCSCNTSSIPVIEEYIDLLNDWD